MPTYIPNAAELTEPVESRTVESAALEFRTLKTDHARTLKFPAGESSSSQADLPAVADRAGKFLYFNSVTGKPEPVVGTPPTSAQIENGSVTAAKIADANVTAVKLAAGAAVANIGYTPANDSAVVHTTGNETVAGNKTFSGTTQLGTITDGTNSTSVTNAINGSAKAWVNFSGVMTAIVRASFNVSSVTRNGTGNYTINFANALPDSNYSVVGQVRRSSDSALVHQMALWASDTKTSSSIQVRSSDGNTGALTDMPEINVSIFR